MAIKVKSNDIILPGSIIGILGSGQLGRMFTLKAISMGYRIHIYSSEEKSPAGLIAEQETVGDYSDKEAIANFASEVDVLTFEFENISKIAVQAAAENTLIRPNPEALATAQNRLDEKRFLSKMGYPIAPWIPLTSESNPVTDINYPIIVKTAGFGYDGKGQTRATNRAELSNAIKAAEGNPLIAEEVVRFDREISIIGARSPSGEYHDFGPFENKHDINHILNLSSSPVQMSERLLRYGRQLVHDMMEQLDIAGLLCVEFFQVGDHLVVNEIAPRPHNSGHLTMDAFVTSQFEQHIRAICGLPLVQPFQHSPAAMANLLGDLWLPDTEPVWQRVLEMSDIKLHLYAKNTARSKRKMGHLTALSSDTRTAVRRAEKARSLLI